MIVIGIDLSIQRPSAVVAMNKCEILYLALAESDDDIITVVSLMRPLSWLWTPRSHTRRKAEVCEMWSGSSVGWVFTSSRLSWAP
jgi:predicted nuclease with RNAse H fold